MRLVTLAFVVLLNLSSANLHNVMVVVGDEAEQIGTIPKGEYRKLETLPQDSIRVIFTLGQKREGWLGTEKMTIRDTIKIDDNTQTFEIVIE
jgi:hypothetical protein